MTFEDYLVQKRIDASTLEKSEPEQYSYLKRNFDQMHPNSFTAQKLFLINGLRRTYPIPEERTMPIGEAPKRASRPKIKIPKK